MPFQTTDGVKYFTFQNFGRDLVQGIFTRQGGVSPAPWAALNMGGTVGDNLERVRENRRRALDALGLQVDSVYDAWQVHGVNVVRAEAPRPPEVRPLQADAILTDRPGVSLLMRFADCVPVFLYDPGKKVIAIAHAGWLGTVTATVRSAVQAMHSNYGCAVSDLQAAIGPSIGPDHYEIGPDVVNRVREAFGEASADMLIRREGKIHFDLWSANRYHLEQAGVRQVETAGICTACHTEDWFSHRAEKGRTGRFGAILALQ
jgi:YfiH family protein